jgi:hypothetical protein
MAAKLEERWKSYRDEVLQGVRSRPLIESHKLAFYAGASVVLVHGVPAPAEAGVPLTAEEALQLNVFWGELIATMPGQAKPN